MLAPYHHLLIRWTVHSRLQRLKPASSSFDMLVGLEYWCSKPDRWLIHMATVLIAHVCLAQLPTVRGRRVVNDAVALYYVSIFLVKRVIEPAQAVIIVRLNNCVEVLTLVLRASPVSSELGMPRKPHNRRDAFGRRFGNSPAFIP